MQGQHKTVEPPDGRTAYTLDLELARMAAAPGGANVRTGSEVRGRATGSIIAVRLLVPRGF
jgi:hypothetical protein